MCIYLHIFGILIEISEDRLPVICVIHVTNQTNIFPCQFAFLSNIVFVNSIDVLRFSAYSLLILHITLHLFIWVQSVPNLYRQLFLHHPIGFISIATTYILCFLNNFNKLSWACWFKIFLLIFLLNSFKSKHLK